MEPEEKNRLINQAELAGVLCGAGCVLGVDAAWKFLAEMSGMHGVYLLAATMLCVIGTARSRRLRQTHQSS